MRFALAGFLVTFSQATDSTCTEIQGLGQNNLDPRSYSSDNPEKVTLENCKKCAGTAKCLYDMQLLYFNTVKAKTEDDGKFLCSDLQDFFDTMSDTCGMLKPEEIQKWRDVNKYDMDSYCTDAEEGDDPEIPYVRFSTSQQPWQKSMRGAMPSEEEGCELNSNEAVVCWSGKDINVPRDLYDGYYPYSFWPVSSGGVGLDGWTQADDASYVNEDTGETRQANDPPFAPYAAYGMNDSDSASGCVAEFEKLATASIAKFQPEKQVVKVPAGASTTPEDSAAPATALALAILATFFAAI